MSITTGIQGFPKTHGKDGSSGGTTIINGGSASIPSDLNLNSITASQGSIRTLSGVDLEYNDALFKYASAEDAQINKLRGNELNYAKGRIADIQSDTTKTGSLTADEMSSIKGYIKSLLSDDITTEYLTVTKQAHFFELIVDKVRAVGGTLLMTQAQAVIDYAKALYLDGDDPVYVDLDDEEDTEYYDVFFLASDKNSGREITNDWIPGDQAYCQSFNNVSEGVNYDISNKYYWRLVTDILDDRYMNLDTGEEVSLDEIEEAEQNDEPNPAEWNKVVINQPYVMYNDLSSTLRIFRNCWSIEAQSDVTTIWNQTHDITEQEKWIEGEMWTQNTDEGIELSLLSGWVIGSSFFGFGCSAARLNIEVYYKDGGSEFFPAPTERQTNYQVELTNSSGIDKIVITNAEIVSWKLVHGIRLSNISGECDKSFPQPAGQQAYTNTASIPSKGDNLAQLGYRWTQGDTNEKSRGNAIIIAAYKSPDAGCQSSIMGEHFDPIVPPSYAQYEAIGSDSNHYFDLAYYRKTYMDGTGAKFVGDITLCSIRGTNVEQVIEDATEDLDSIKLMPKEEQLEAKILSSITAQNHRVNLKCKLVYDVRYKHGDTIENIDLTQQSSSNIYYKIRFFVTYVNGTPSPTYYEFTNMQHLYSNSYEAANLLDVINVSNNSDAYRDYMKCYNDHPDCCPLYLTVELVKVDPNSIDPELQTPTETVVDQRVVNVGLENGALFSVTDNRISSQVASSLNNYYTKSQIDQTAESITSSVTTGYTQTYMNGYSKVIDLTSVAPHCFVPVGISFKYDEDNHEIGDSKGGFRAEGYNISIDRNFSADYGAPDYSYHTNGSSVADGFVFGCSWHTVASGYGTNWGNTQDQDAQGWYAIEKNGTNLDTYRFITGNDCTWTQEVTYVPNDSSTKIPANYICGSIRQNYRTSEELIYLRGGSKYNVRTDCLLNCRIQAYTGIDGYVDNTGGRTVRMPMLNLNYTGWNTLIVPVKDQMKRSEIVQTADNIELNVYDNLKTTGIDIESGRITLDGDNVDVIGNLNVTGTQSSFQFVDDNGNVRLNVGNTSMPNKNKFLGGNIQKWFQGVYATQTQLQGYTDYISIGQWNNGIGAIEITGGTGCYMLMKTNTGGGQFDGASMGMTVSLIPSLYYYNGSSYVLISTGSTSITNITSTGDFQSTIGSGTFNATQSNNTEYFIRYAWYVSGSNIDWSRPNTRYEIHYYFTYTPNNIKKHVYFSNDGFGILYNNNTSSYFYTGREETEIKYSGDDAQLLVNWGGTHIRRYTEHITSNSDKQITKLGDYYLETVISGVNIKLHQGHIYYDPLPGDYIRIYNLTGTRQSLWGYGTYSDAESNKYYYKIVTGDGLTILPTYTTPQTEIYLFAWSRTDLIWDGSAWMVFRYNIRQS